MKTITISASVPMFDYSQLTIETRIKVQQLETEIDEGHAEVQVLMTQTLDKMWGVGEKYSRVQELLEAHQISFKSWFLSKYGSEAMLRKAYKCIRIYSDLTRDKLSLVADYGKSVVYEITARNTPQAARDEIIERLSKGEELSADDLANIIENHTIVSTPWLLPGIEPVASNEADATGIETFQHLTPGNENVTHIVDANEMVTPAVTGTHEVGANRLESMKPVGKPHFTSAQLNTTHAIGDKPAPGPAAQWLEKQKAAATPPKAESPTTTAPIATPPPPPLPPPPAAAKPVSELAKVEYDDHEADEDEDDGPIELTPIAPPPPPASAIPLPPPPPLVVRSQIDIAVEFSKLSAEKQFEVAYLMLTKMTKQQVKELFIKYQTQGEK